MIRLDCAQRSPEWYAARIGIPTASCFDQIVTPKTMKLSASADKYLNRLLAEWMLGVCLDDVSTQFMERGADLEESAIAFYELQREADTEEVGFCLRDDRAVGCSPDRLVGADGLLEIKCPSPAVHVGYILNGFDAYRCQTQGQLWVTGRSWLDLLSYHPQMPPVLVRVERDEEFIAALSSGIEWFLTQLAAAKSLMIERGYKEAA